MIIFPVVAVSSSTETFVFVGDGDDARRALLLSFVLLVLLLDEVLLLIIVGCRIVGWRLVRLELLARMSKRKVRSRRNQRGHRCSFMGNNALCIFFSLSHPTHFFIQRCQHSRCATVTDISSIGRTGNRGRFLTEKMQLPFYDNVSFREYSPGSFRSLV